MTARKLREKQHLVLDARKELVSLARGGDAEARADLMWLHGMRVYTPAEVRPFEKLQGVL